MLIFRTLVEHHLYALASEMNVSYLPSLMISIRAGTRNSLFVMKSPFQELWRLLQSRRLYQNNTHHRRHDRDFKNLSKTSRRSKPPTSSRDEVPCLGNLRNALFIRKHASNSMFSSNLRQATNALRARACGSSAHQPQLRG